MGSDGCYLERLAKGQRVAIVRKQHQRSGTFTYGEIAAILTKKSYHSHGIKVKLRDGAVGRVKEILK